MNKGIWIFILVSNFSSIFLPTNGAKILALFSTPSKSHVIVHTSLMRELAERGHIVTVVTSFSVTEPLPANYREIIVLPNTRNEKNTVFNNLLKHAENETSQISDMFAYIQTLTSNAQDFINDPGVTNLRNETFDLLVLGYMFNDFQIGVAAHFQCPIVVISTLKSSVLFRQLVGNPDGVAYTASPFLNFKGRMSFGQRLINFITTVVEHLITWAVNYFVHEPIYRRNFPPDRYPSFDETRQNISLVLNNYHFSQGAIEAYLPAMVEVGGMHIGRETAELPQGVKQFLDNATDGAILFSLGSNVKSSEMSIDKREALLRVFGKLKQKVVWKWEDDHLPDQPDNVLISKWVPQSKILGHHNVRLFISHCGLSSITEAMYYGVPVLGMPIFGDQSANCRIIENDGWARVLPFSQLTESSFELLLQAILGNSTFVDKVRSISTLYRDRPQSALDTAVYWVEYVMRHDGAKHMQSPGVHLNYIQYHSLDVIGLILLCIFVSCKFIAIVWRRIVGKVFGKLIKNKRD